MRSPWLEAVFCLYLRYHKWNISVRDGSSRKRSIFGWRYYQHGDVFTRTKIGGTVDYCGHLFWLWNFHLVFVKSLSSWRMCANTKISIYLCAYIYNCIFIHIFYSYFFFIVILFHYFFYFIDLFSLSAFVCLFFFFFLNFIK